MSTQFEIGEVAILQNATHYHEFDGSLCLIKSNFRYCEGLDVNIMEYIPVYICDVQILTDYEVPGTVDNVVGVRPHQLRKFKFRYLDTIEKIEFYNKHVKNGQSLTVEEALQI